MGTQFGNPGLSTGGYIEFFSGQTSDANGDVTVTLSRTPTSDADVFIICNNNRRVAHFQSRTGASLTIRTTKLRYDKATAPAGAIISQPSGVTVRTATAGVTTSSNGAHTHGGATGANQSAGINPTAGIAGLSADDATHTHTISSDGAHTHTFNELWDHGHTLTQTETDQVVAASQSGLNFVVVYR